MNQNVIISTNENDIWKLIKKARQGNIVRLLGIGNSMRPFLEGGRDYIVLIAVSQTTKLCKNDVVFYKDHANQYVTHRIYSISEKGYSMNGDGNLSIEPSTPREQIYLKATGFIRKGKYISANSKLFKGYSYLWRKLFPIRLHVLRLFQRYYKMISIFKKEKNMRIKEDLMLRNINEDWIVIPMGERLLEFNGMIKLNQSGSFIWKLLETEKSRAEIITAMLDEYDLDEKTAAQEFDSFLKILISANVLEA